LPEVLPFQQRHRQVFAAIEGGGAVFDQPAAGGEPLFEAVDGGVWCGPAMG
jgi:hypothetical protein